VEGDVRPASYPAAWAGAAPTPCTPPATTLSHPNLTNLALNLTLALALIFT